MDFCRRGTGGNKKMNMKKKILKLLAHICCCKDKNREIAVGKIYKGGVIAYLNDSGQHGIIAAPNDQSSGISWYDKKYILTNACETSIGSGLHNTSIIVSLQTEGKYAANLCAYLTLEGYHDWFLPSIDELELLYQSRYAIGGFSGSYWSSSEYKNSIHPPMYAIGKNFDTGLCIVDSKRTRHKVRAIRFF
jgi:hypothetical protein